MRLLLTEYTSLCHQLNEAALPMHIKCLNATLAISLHVRCPCRSLSVRTWPFEFSDLTYSLKSVSQSLISFFCNQSVNLIPAASPMHAEMTDGPWNINTTNKWTVLDIQVIFLIHKLVLFQNYKRSAVSLCCTILPWHVGFHGYDRLHWPVGQNGSWSTR